MKEAKDVLVLCLAGCGFGRREREGNHSGHLAVVKWAGRERVSVLLVMLG